MATKQAKKHCRRKEGDETGVDRISELPDPLIHHILSYVPTFYAVRTSILSKRWRHMWVHIPVLYFHDFRRDVTFLKMFDSTERSFFFIKFVSNCLKHHNLSSQFSADTFITRFKLDMGVDYSFEGNFHIKINEWLSNAFIGNLKELDLCIVPSNGRSFYCLPQSVFNSRLLTLLTLKRMKLSINFPVSLPSLKVLYLESVNCFEYSLQNLISGCSSIEDLHLGYFGCSLRKTDLVVSGALRNLTLWGMPFANEDLDYLLSGIPLLEKLTIFPLSSRKNIRIQSHSVKLCDKYSTIDAQIMTPNLVSFVFEGRVMSVEKIGVCSNFLQDLGIDDQRKKNN